LKKVLAIALAAAGLFGFFSIRLFEFSPPPLVSALIGVGFFAFLALLALFERRKEHQESPELEPYLRNPVRGKRKPWVATRKVLHVTVPPGKEDRRTPTLRVDLTVCNRSRQAIGQMTFPLGGDSWARSKDLAVTAKVGGTPAQVSVEDKEGYSPVITLPFPAPGLPPGETIEVSVHWRWPGMVRMEGGPWVLGLNDVRTGSDACLCIDYPEDSRQHAQVCVIRALGPLKWDQVEGSLTPIQESGAWRYEVIRQRTRFDSYLKLDMELDST